MEEDEVAEDEMEEETRERRRSEPALHPTVTTSVRDLVEFVYASGDLVAAELGTARARAGTEGHGDVRRMRPAGYEAEVDVRTCVAGPVVDVVVQGRADGLFRDGDRLVVDEVKTTTRDLELFRTDEDCNPLHWHQATVYGHLFALRDGLAPDTAVDVQLTYYHLPTGALREFRRTRTAAELADFFDETVAAYRDWIERLVAHERRRDLSAADLPFPYATMRPGQAELADAVASTIAGGGRLFVRAPTGIGKTAAVLWPAVRALGAGTAKTKQIFYLTARTTGRAVAEATLADMRAAGLCIRAVTLTAKDKICAYPAATCHPGSCPRAAGHYSRLRGAMTAALEHQDLTRAVIEELAARHEVCPFEYSLDLASCADVVVCDYNYVFDPRVHLRRFFDGGRLAATLLVDEAHNLVDRGRDMFSAELTKRAVLDGKTALRAEHPDVAALLHEVNRWFLDQGRRMREEGGGERNGCWSEQPTELVEAVGRFRTAVEPLLLGTAGSAGGVGPSYDRDCLLDLYFAACAFVRAAERYDYSYVTLLTGTGSSARVRLYCVDPARFLRAVHGRLRATVFFSATLTPLEYHRDILGGDVDDTAVSLPSPFPPEHLCLLVADRVATTYKRRHTSYELVARAVAAMTGARRGNYLVFFPSYAYLREVFGRFAALAPSTATMVQQSGMSEVEREQFLGCFRSDAAETLVAFAVMGGVFGEGIDLLGDRLVGVAVVGVGLPQVCLEREVIRRHFDERFDMGFAYAYQYPGMTRVLQAAGRLIRSEDDRGVLLLLDERFAHESTRELLPSEWPAAVTTRTPDALREVVETFWSSWD